VNQNGNEGRTIHSVGIEVHGGRAVVLIPRGCRTPVARAMTFTTVADGQGAVEVRIVRCIPAGAGRAPWTAPAAHDPQISRPDGVVGRFLVPGLRPARRGEARIDIGVSLDREGVLRAWGRDRHTGALQAGTFPGSWALPPAARAAAASRLARRLEADLEIRDEHGLRPEGRLLRRHAEEATGGPFLAALAGELDTPQRSAVQPPLPVP
jgi:molecular chaperone DnaK